MALSSSQCLTATPARADKSASVSGFLYFSFVVFALALVWFTPRPGGEIAVLASPFAGAAKAAQIAADADSDIVERGCWPNLLILKPKAANTVARLYRAGAWLVFNPNAIAGCFNKA